MKFKIVGLTANMIMYNPCHCKKVVTFFNKVEFFQYKKKMHAYYRKFVNYSGKINRKATIVNILEISSQCFHFSVYNL